MQNSNHHRTSDLAIDQGWYLSSPERMLSWSRRAERDPDAATTLRQYIYMQMAAQDLVLDEEAKSRVDLPDGLLANLEEKNRLLAQLRAPIDYRIEAFLSRYFSDVVSNDPLHLPDQTLVLDQHGLARRLSLPDEGDQFQNSLVSSYRLNNGVLHNPKADRRTTQGTFHVTEGGLAIAGDKRAVPKVVFAHLFRHAIHPPTQDLVLPFTQSHDVPAKTFVSLLIRPLVAPAVPGYCEHKSMEIRFFAPGGLVSNLDFVESIFGNAGDPLVPENDAALDCEHWTGHTGCVILAPHLVQLTKKELGLPEFSQATDRQKQDGMCWKDPNEKYNDGQAFKITCRDASGVIVTLIADNYFGYCKKEVKTQISYAANLMGNAEEEHAGGTLAFVSHNLGEEFQWDSRRYNGRSFQDLERDYASFIDVRPEGYGVDRIHPNLVYVPENAFASLFDRTIKWTRDGQEKSIPLEQDCVYMAPSGYKVQMEKHPCAPSWRLIGTGGEGTVCHKPCTVSGGGKSEISKSLRDYMQGGPIFVADIDSDFAQLQRIFDRDYADRWRTDSTEKPDYSARDSRKVLDPSRTLGSVIKLLTPSREYTDEYNKWLASIPTHLYAMAFIIKRFCKPEWHGQWQDKFGVDVVNGDNGHELKFGNRKLVGMYLRVGLDPLGRWRMYKLRQDFAAASKIQLEDDITASVVVPKRFLPTLPDTPDFPAERSYKLVANCEYRLFQRPDDAVHRGLDKQTETDVADVGNFFCNFEPLVRNQIEAEIANIIDFEQYSAPMQERMNAFLSSKDRFVVSSAQARLVDGKPSKNPRYLQDRPDLTKPFDRYVGFRGIQLYRATPANAPVPIPVGAILSGRRNNPPDARAGIRSLAVYGPIHYQELPELVMDYVCSLTGKSPSTTGAGSEGALTKAPFNALSMVYDLNATMVSMILSGLGGFSTAAGHIGPEIEVGHDISMLVPEIWCRLRPEEREPAFLIREGLLEKLSDFVHEGVNIPASRLGYRITARFVRRYFGRVFDNPSKVFDERILYPEKQDLSSYADGILYIAEAQKRVADIYLADGSYEIACPPLQAILSIMSTGTWNGFTLDSSEVRSMFSREGLLASDWYANRVAAKQKVDVDLWRRNVQYLSEYCSRPTHSAVTKRLDLKRRLKLAQESLAACQHDSYRDFLQGTIGTDPSIQIG
jgi:phosphoenolpyruvate carboxykinase (diphosphate)